VLEEVKSRLCLEFRCLIEVFFFPIRSPDDLFVQDFPGVYVEVEDKARSQWLDLQELK